MNTVRMVGFKTTFAGLLKDLHIQMLHVVYINFIIYFVFF